MNDCFHHHRTRRSWLIQLGNAEGVLAAIAALTGFLIPATPGSQTELRLWLVVGVLGVIGGLAVGGIRHGSALGKKSGILALVVIIVAAILVVVATSRT